ncbi:MAG: MMPL family transporter [Planctomycetota bacterium]
MYVPADERRPDTLAALALAGEIAHEPLVRPMPGLPRRSESGSILLTALLHPGGTAERERLFARVEAAAEARGLHGARVTGAAVRVARDSEELVRDQRRSLFAMVLFVWIALAIGFRSIKLAVIGIVPNVVPIAALYGGLALAGRPLSASTAMIGTVFLGLVVDDTIHFLHGYRAARERGLSPRMAVASAYSRSGRAITVTTAVLCLGFGAAVMGRLETTIEFAVVSALVILLAWICDLLVLPALLMLGSPILRSNAPRTRRFSLPWIESTT